MGAFLPKPSPAPRAWPRPRLLRRLLRRRLPLRLPRRPSPRLPYASSSSRVRGVRPPSRPSAPRRKRGSASARSRSRCTARRRVLRRGRGSCPSSTRALTSSAHPTSSDGSRPTDVTSTPTSRAQNAQVVCFSHPFCSHVSRRNSSPHVTTHAFPCVTLPVFPICHTHPVFPHSP